MPAGAVTLVVLMSPIDLRVLFLAIVCLGYALFFNMTPIKIGQKKHKLEPPQRVSIPICRTERSAEFAPEFLNQAGGKSVWPSARARLPLRSREYYHIFLNPERYPQARILSLEYLDAFLSDAEIYMQQDDPTAPLPNLCTFVEWEDSMHFRERMMELYHGMMRESFVKWQSKGSPPKWYSQNKEGFIAYLINEAPFHLTDGSWLNGIAVPGPQNTVHSNLIRIWLDEIGNGTVEQNHASVYEAVLRAAGVHLPPVESEDFMNCRLMMDAAFVNPAVALAFSLHPRRLLPEILGETLFLELSSPALHSPLAQELHRFGFSNQFSRLHTAIDNPTSGHAAMAVDAVVAFMDRCSSTSGLEVAKKMWKRIWMGFTCYAISGGYQSQFAKLVTSATPRSSIVRLVSAKASAASVAHGKTKLDGQFLNDWFQSVDELVDALAESRWIAKGNPEKSLLLIGKCAFSGPMYKVFSEEELEIIRQWILSLK